MPKWWRIHPHDAAEIQALERAAHLPAVVAQLLVCRGMRDPEAVRQFLDPKLGDLRDPDELPGVPAAADRVMAAITERRKIYIYGDYDVDGMTATAILTQCLRLLGADVAYYIPNRVDEGYGLNDEALKTLADRGAQMVITVDCGVASLAEAETARTLGLELIITDHHEMAERLPNAAAIVHPRLPGTTYPFGGLCGAGVAFKLAWAICQRANQAKRVSERMRDFLVQAVGLVALGTVADVVPLVDENRILVKHGLRSLREQPTLGMAALMKLTKLDEKRALGAEDIGFTLAPRLNAAGRLGQGTLGVELLITDSTERATALSEYLNELNGSRESLERSIYLAANKQAQEEFDPEADAALVLASNGWHPGVIGIVASRLVEKFHRPVVMIALDELGLKPGVGSARSVPGFDLCAALRACGATLQSCGGHAVAAGLKIDPARIDEFRACFVEHAAAEITSAQRVAELRIDAEVSFSSLTVDAVLQLERMAPFGSGNPRPVMCTTDVSLVDAPKKMGGGERHLALRLRQHNLQLRGVAFGGGEWCDEIAAVEGGLAVAFRPVINEFKGRRNVELHICDWRSALEPHVLSSSSELGSGSQKQAIEPTK
jgi:single-stranded-DNA-specific exonuclease